MAAVDRACELACSPPRLLSSIVDPSTVLAQGSRSLGHVLTTARGSLSSVCTVQVTELRSSLSPHTARIDTACIGYAPRVDARAFLAKKWRGHWFWRPSQSLGAAVLLGGTSAGLSEWAVEGSNLRPWD